MLPPNVALLVRKEDEEFCLAVFGTKWLRDLKLRIVAGKDLLIGFVEALATTLVVVFYPITANCA